MSRTFSFSLRTIGGVHLTVDGHLGSLEESATVVSRSQSALTGVILSGLKLRSSCLSCGLLTESSPSILSYWWPQQLESTFQVNYQYKDSLSLLCQKTRHVSICDLILYFYITNSKMFSPGSIKNIVCLSRRLYSQGSYRVLFSMVTSYRRRSMA